jgi:primase-polymerase (primpol)-like protein
MNIPEELTALRQWIIWRFEDRGGPKPTKVPHTTMGYRASATNPEHWSTLDAVLRAADRPGFADGIGFVFTADDPYCGIDLDNVWKGDADEGPRWAREILDRFADTYLEESPSGQGVKIWCRAKASRCGAWKIEDGSIEIYDRSRFFTVTTRSNGIRVITDHQADMDSLIAHLGAGAAASAAAIGAVIPYGTQHRTLMSLAGTMWRRGFSVEAINAALQETNAHQCEKPGPPENIRKIAEDVSRYPR